MAPSTPLSSQCSPNLLQLPINSPQFRLILAGISLSHSKYDFSRKLLLLQQRNWDPLRPIVAKEVGIKCFAEGKEGNSAGEALLDDEVAKDVTIEEEVDRDFSNGSVVSQRTPATGDSLSLGIREPVYEVIYTTISYTTFLEFRVFQLLNMVTFASSIELKICDRISL